MQPRVDIVAVSVDTPASAILQLAVDSKYSRIPVYENDVDHIVGLVFCKDLLEWVEAEGGAVPGAEGGRTLNAVGEPVVSRSIGWHFD